MRDAVYSPEFSIDSAAVNTTALTKVDAAGTPKRPNADANGLVSLGISRHGVIITSSATEPT